MTVNLSLQAANALAHLRFAADAGQVVAASVFPQSVVHELERKRLVAVIRDPDTDAAVTCDS